MAEKKRVIVEAVLRNDKRGLRMRYPLEVRKVLSGEAGDGLLFEQATSFRVAELAATQGPYFVVRLKRAKPPEPEPAPEPDNAVRASEESSLEPLAAVVERKLREQKR